jgi:MFS family permease
VADHQHSGEVSASPFAPFRHRAFFWLWLGAVIASIGSWGQTVGAQWLFVNDPNAATIVPLVQTASTLPMMLLALPAGVLADAFDRRWMMFVIQVYFITVSALLAFLTAVGRMPPALLLTFTFAVGAGQAMLSPTWQAMITELVPRSEFAAATRLDMVSVNVSRAAGPAIAGFVIASWGVPPVFALNVATGCVLAVVLLAWRRPTIQAGQRERFLPPACSSVWCCGCRRVRAWTAPHWRTGTRRGCRSIPSPAAGRSWSPSSTRWTMLAGSSSSMRCG